MKYRSINPGPDDLDRRLDRIIRKSFPDLGLGEIYKHLRKGDIRVNMSKNRPDYRLKRGDIIHISEYLFSGKGANKSAVFPLDSGTSGIDSIKNNSPLSKPDILVEDDKLLFINKPSGILSHGKKSLNEQVNFYLKGKIPDSLSFTPGPLHRLDRNTSGIITFGKSLEGARVFSEKLKSGDLSKYYLTIVRGRLKKKGVWEGFIDREDRKSRMTDTTGGKKAVTSYKPLILSDNFTLLLIKLHTGRTHQIRTQAADSGHVLLNDVKYGYRKTGAPFFLHAWILKARNNDFPPLPINAPPPAAFTKKLEDLFPGKNISTILEKEKNNIFTGLEDL